MILPIISERSKIRKTWDAIMAVALVAAALVLPAAAALAGTKYALDTVALRDFQVVLTVLFFADILLNFRTSFFLHEEEIRCPRRIAAHYLRGWFFVDLAATIPFFLIFPESDLSFLFKAARLTSLLRLVRLIKLWSQISWYFSTITQSAIARLLIFLFWAPLFIHWMACGWMAINPPIEPAPPATITAFHVYLQALYFTTTTVTTIGFGDITPDKLNPLALIYTMAMQVIGAGMYGYIIGNVASFLANIDASRTHHLEKLDRINAFMKYEKIPEDLQDRIRNYFSYLWKTRHGHEESKIFHDLPPALRDEVALHLRSHIISKVPFLKDCQPELIRELIVAMSPVLYTPGDFIIRKGELGDSMYFVAKGHVEIVSEDGRAVHATLGEGSFFGEIAILKSTPRTASVRAADYCDLYRLEKRDFDRVLTRHPDFASHIHKITEERETAGSRSEEN